MQSWNAFYGAIAGACATLLGLLFVALSIKVSSPYGRDTSLSRRLTEQAFSNYLSVMIVSFVALFPGIGMRTMGLATMAVAAPASVWAAVRLWQTGGELRAQQSRSPTIRRHLPSIIGLGMLLVAAVRLAYNSGSTGDLLAASLLVMLLSAVSASWELMRRIAQPGSP